jgi:predicted enzyme related to lactoylglutathione lyase
MLKDNAAFSGYSVDDVPSAKRFYEETLGLEVSEEGPGITLKLAGGNNVLVYGKGSDHEPATFTVLNFEVADIDAAVDGLTERGVEFERYEGTALETDEKGVFRGDGPLIAWFKDPAGNVLSVIQTA